MKRFGHRPLGHSIGMSRLDAQAYLRPSLGQMNHLEVRFVPSGKIIQHGASLGPPQSPSLWWASLGQTILTRSLRPSIWTEYPAWSKSPQPLPRHISFLRHFSLPTYVRASLEQMILLRFASLHLDRLSSAHHPHVGEVREI